MLNDKLRLNVSVNSNTQNYTTTGDGSSFNRGVYRCLLYTSSLFVRDLFSEAIEDISDTGCRKYKIKKIGTRGFPERRCDMYAVSYTHLSEIRLESSCQLTGENVRMERRNTLFSISEIE